MFFDVIFFIVAVSKRICLIFCSPGIGLYTVAIYIKFTEWQRKSILNRDSEDLGFGPGFVLACVPQATHFTSLRCCLIPCKRMLGTKDQQALF